MIYVLTVAWFEGNDENNVYDMNVNEISNWMDGHKSWRQEQAERKNK